MPLNGVELTKNKKHKYMKPIKNYEEFINEAWIGPFVFNEDMTDDELKAIYQGALDGFAYWQKGFEYPKADYKKAYQEIEKILKKRGVNVDESINEGDMTKDYDGFIVLDYKSKKTYKFKYVKGTSNVKVEDAAISKLMASTKAPRSNFAVHGFVRKGEWDKSDVEVLESSVNEGSKDEMVKKEAISRLSDFFRVSPGPLMKFKFDGSDNIKDLTKVLNSTSDQGTELYYKTAIKLAKEEVGVEESVNEKLDPNKLHDILATFIDIAGKLTKVDLSHIARQQPRDLDDCIRLILNELPKEVKNKFVNQAEKYIETKKIKESVNEAETLIFDEIGENLTKLQDQIDSMLKWKITDQKWIVALKGIQSACSKLEDTVAKADQKLGAIEYNESLSEGTLKLDEGAVKQFEIDYKDMESNIKRGIGWIDPEYVAETWENSSDTIDYEIVRNEILTRLIKAGLLYTSQDGETKDKKITNISQIK